MCDEFITTMTRDEDDDGSVSQRSNKSTTSRRKNGFNRKKIQGDIKEPTENKVSEEKTMKGKVL